MRFRIIGLSALVAMAACCGCNSSAGPALAPATGTVHFRGQPLVGARVIFNPASGRPAQGTTDTAGHFQLSTLRPGDGAVVGTHRVSVTAARTHAEMMPGPNETPAPQPAGPDALPPRYADPQTSGLEYEVKPDTKNDFALELE